MTDDRQTLPLPDYDHLPLEALRERIRSLDASELERLLEHERAHGNRLPVVQVMQARLDRLHEGATPSGGDPTGTTPETSDGTAPDAEITSTTDAPPSGPPAQGVPGNPHGPR